MATDRAAVAVVSAALPPEEEDEAQRSLWDEPESAGGQSKVAHVNRGPGRPKGARNKRTERTVAWLMSKHRDPRECLLAVTDMHPADLAHLLGCSFHEAVQEQRLCASVVLPYVAQRQPLAIDVTNKSVVYLTINEGGQVGDEAGGLGLAGTILDNVEFQDLSADDTSRVGQSELDSTAAQGGTQGAAPIEHVIADHSADGAGDAPAGPDQAEGGPTP